MICLSVLNSLIYFVKDCAKTYFFPLNLTDKVLNLLFNSHKFEFFYNYWRLILSLISESVGLIKVRINWLNI
jgi:hypothetical protein